MAKKRKRLNITPQDRVVGVQPRQKRDLLAGCNEPGKAWFNRDDHEFIKAYCTICKNADCMRARGAVSPWHTRMAEQVDYLLNDPDFSELSSPEHRDLAQMAFDDISRQAMRLEVARQRQDWTIPDEPTDGVDKVASPATTDQFDDAVRKLAEAKGKKAPEFERPEQKDGPAHFERAPDEEVEDVAPAAAEEEEWEYDTHYPSSDGSRTYHVTLSKKGEWACDCKGFQYKQTCKHLDTVKAWYDDQVEQAAERERREAEEQARRQQTPALPSEPPPPRDSRVPDTRYNTPMPQGGVMVGGSKPPATPPEPDDPWAIPANKPTVVKPGAVVKLKEDKKDG